MARGILRLARDASGELFYQLVWYPAQEAYRQLAELRGSELHDLAPNWAVLIGGNFHQYRQRGEAEFLFNSARNAELV